MANRFAAHSVKACAFSVFFVLALAAHSPSSAMAQESSRNPYDTGPTLLVYFENDLFYNNDGDYTNAVQVRLISPDLHTLASNGYLPDWLGNILGRVPLPGSRSATRYNVSFSAGQQMYTPKETQERRLQKDDRPYAGYLYGALALHAKHENRLDTLELAAGIVGPGSLAKQTQTEVHKIAGVESAKGWDHQLHDEPALMLTWSRIWRVNADALPGSWGWDLLPRTAISLGNPYTRAGVGTEFRFGWNLPPDYGSAGIRPGAGITRPVEEETVRRGNGFLENFSAFAFVGVEGNAVARNAFLDGNMWRDSHSVDKFPLAADITGGIGLEIRNFQITYTNVLRAKEFHGGRYQNFGSITVGYRF